MRNVLVAYDISMLKTAIAKEVFIENLKRVYNLNYDYFESEGDLHSSNYVCVVQYSCLDDTIITRIITVVNKQTLKEWWNHRGAIIPAVYDDINLGGL